MTPQQDEEAQMVTFVNHYLHPSSPLFTGNFDAASFSSASSAGTESMSIDDGDEDYRDYSRDWSVTSGFGLAALVQAGQIHEDHVALGRLIPPATPSSFSPLDRLD